MTTLARLLALAGAGLLVAATLMPVNRGGAAGYEYALYDNAVDLNLRWFALEPLGVACGVVLVVVVSLLWHDPAIYALLAAAGAQTTVLFVGYVGNAIFGPSSYNSFGPGGGIGIVGAIAILVAGVLGFVGSRRAGQRGAARRVS
jgi:hypothetical protein